MLNFLKKSGRSFVNDEKFVPEKTKGNSMSSWQLTDNTPLDEYLENHEINEAVQPRSRLSMNLYDILADRTCLSYFIQFLETKSALSLIKFYLDSESFKTVAEKEIASIENNNNYYYYNYSNAIRRHHSKSISSDNFDKISLNSSNFDVTDSVSLGSQLTNVTMNCDQLISNSSMSLDEKLEEQMSDKEITEINQINESNEQINTNVNLHKNCNLNSLKTVPELKTLCDLSLRKPLTDDEKSLLVLAENNKIYHKRISKSISANNFSEQLSSNVNCENFKPNVSSREMAIRQKNVYTSIASDAIRIYRKYLTSNSPYFIDIPATILSTISLQICAQNKSSADYENSEKNHDNNNKTSETDDNSEEDINSISCKCFSEAQKYILERLEADYLSEFLESSFYCKYIVDILSNVRSLTISDILHSESALFYFMEFLEQKQNHRGLLEFWVAAINFRKHYLNLSMNADEDIYSDTESSEDLLQSDAMILYDKYFSLQANNPLPISSRIRSQIEEKICSSEIDEICKCFDVAIKVVELFFERVYFQEFLSSQLFVNYFNDLKSKIPDYNSSDIKTNSNRIKSGFKMIRHRKTLSDCTAESTKEVKKRFLSQQNSLSGQGMENSKFKTSRSADMKIDSRHLNDPDLLWKRNSRNGLIFGRVNSLGRYERDFEVNFNNEEKWTLASGSHKLKNAMRKFVNLPEDKVQEEIAWQIAEMIVKDITNVTLGNSDSNDI
ncbi:A-kinase anchor protein 10, mitochondrial isoform X2 [Condylostylus longicornis]|uniref:A-kinase anchor protein 10, mitochondrial isoform X2 n=1 Tax=Condylostylus longicornis TaxID=2530218 RepID=UPI00244DFD2E|nr:A-kinase anchor protein 10, mitochondrial isoform X2 [Condylostylus longicornis]